ncbi:MAG: type III secretion system cytoplasmic ring protein SctQ [Chloracidobacterium sp.]|nr:type III secretion system cytoplasmic ring protein SctQ [Chloracidobacterium sp.]MDW8218022.1 type III secretion system cytoplasmic ring protein SctQ [Acidobacteriota bacterium]
MSEVPDDPFAFDLFAQPVVAPDEEEVAAAPETEPPRERRWYDALPKLTQVEAASGRELGGAPTWLFGAMFRAAAPRLLTILRTPPELFGISSFGLAEVAANELGRATEDRRFCATLGVGQGDAAVFLQTDAGFAAALVERMLGGSGTPPDSVRQVSSAEAAALEFLLLAMAWDVNAFLGEPALRLTSCARWLSYGHFLSATSDPNAPTRRLVGAVSMKFAEVVGFAEFIFDAAALSALRTLASRVMARPLTDPALALIRQKRLAELAKLQPTLPMAVEVGAFEAAYRELQTLEVGDFVVLETIQSVLQPGEAGSVTVGGTENLRLFGDFDDTLRLIVRDLLPASPLSLLEENVAMPVEETAAPAVALDDLTVTVRVELAARRMRLEEVAQLRVGHVLELGCKPTDPVTLTLDGRPIARGELVDIEGRLGVRITQARS